jgi:hypothetical protein
MGLTAAANGLSMAAQKAVERTVDEAGPTVNEYLAAVADQDDRRAASLYLEGDPDLQFPEFLRDMRAKLGPLHAMGVAGANVSRPVGAGQRGTYLSLDLYTVYRGGTGEESLVLFRPEAGREFSIVRHAVKVADFTACAAARAGASLGYGCG